MDDEPLLVSLADMTTRHRLTDRQWNCIRDLIPELETDSAAGRPRRSDRELLDGMLWRLRTGCAWRDLHEDFEPWQTVYDRWNEWSRSGVFDRIHQW